MADVVRNKDYTNLYTNGFSFKKVGFYNNKFCNWNKRIKHLEQVEFIRRYWSSDCYWCDFPIGSGRLADSFGSVNLVGMDISDGFIDFNRRRNRFCVKQDLFNPGGNWFGKFDLVTCMHTLFAFDDYMVIISNLIKLLNVDGVLVFDIPRTVDKEKLVVFFKDNNCELLEIKKHDFWDNPFFQCLRRNRFVDRVFWRLLLQYFYRFFPRFFVDIQRDMSDEYFCKFLVAVRRNS